MVLEELGFAWLGRLIDTSALGSWCTTSSAIAHVTFMRIEPLTGWFARARASGFSFRLVRLRAQRPTVYRSTIVYTSIHGIRRRRKKPAMTRLTDCNRHLKCRRAIPSTSYERPGRLHYLSLRYVSRCGCALTLNQLVRIHVDWALINFDFLFRLFYNRIRAKSNEIHVDA